MEPHQTLPPTWSNPDTVLGGRNAWRGILLDSANFYPGGWCSSQPPPGMLPSKLVNIQIHSFKN